MNAASCAGGDFNPYVRNVARAAEALLGQAREAMHGMPGAGGKRQEHAEARRGGPWARRGGPWEGGFGWPGPGAPGRPGFGGPGSGGPRGWWPGPPAPPRGPKAGRGDVRAAILALLAEGPRNGYQIMSEVEERSGGAWRPSPGAVYPALQQLADEGLIEAEESGGRRTFSLTEARPAPHRGRPGDGPAGMGGHGPGRAGRDARPVRPGGPARRQHRAAGPCRARPSRSGPLSCCWSGPGGRCTRSWPATTLMRMTRSRPRPGRGRRAGEFRSAGEPAGDDQEEGKGTSHG